MREAINTYPCVSSTLFSVPMVLDPDTERGYAACMMEANNTVGELVRETREAMKLTQAELADEVGTKQQTIEKIESGKIKHSSYLPAIAKRLGIAFDRVFPDTKGRSSALPEAPLLGARDLEVYGSAEGGGGTVIVSNEAVDYVRRPEPLANVRNGYGLIVCGDSMEPAFEAGDIVLVHPHLPPVPGCDVVLYSIQEGEERALIKRLLRATAAEWHLCQHNPPPGKGRNFKLPRSVWKKCHRIVGKFSRR